MKRLFSLLLVVVALQAQAVMQPKKVFIGTKKIPAVVWLSPTYDAKVKNPLICALHGLNEVGDGSDKVLQAKLIDNGNFSALLVNAERKGAVVVMPQVVYALNGYINGFPVEYVNEALNYMFANYSVDVNRLYLTGLSMGGGGVWDYLLSNIANVNRIAAAIPICGTFTVLQTDASLVAASKVPVWAFHAKDDPTVNYWTTKWHIQDVSNFNPDPAVKYTEYATGGHGIWGKVYSDQAVWDWMFAQVNNISTPPLPPAFTPNATIIRADGTKEDVQIINKN